MSRTRVYLAFALVVIVAIGVTTISRQRADRFTMYAPGWRPMAFRSLDAARAKLERHPGFVRWLSHS